jgi:hypothetical protein
VKRETHLSGVPTGRARNGFNGDCRAVRNLRAAGYADTQRAQHGCRIEQDRHVLTDAAPYVRLILVGHGAVARIPEPPELSTTHTVEAVAWAAHTLFAHLITGAPDPDKFRKLGVVLGWLGRVARHTKGCK